MIQINICSNKDTDLLKLEISQFKQRFLTEIESLERKIDFQGRLVCHQTDRITKLESYVDPYSNDGEAICNFCE